MTLNVGENQMSTKSGRPVKNVIRADTCYAAENCQGYIQGGR